MKFVITENKMSQIIQKVIKLYILRQIMFIIYAYNKYHKNY